MADEADTERVTFTIANRRTVNSKSLYALVDVEVQVAELSFVIVGVQVRRGAHPSRLSSPTGNTVRDRRRGRLPIAPRGVRGRLVDGNEPASS